jgi:pterin-4a-carbinolamine dehydratase
MAQRLTDEEIERGLSDSLWRRDGDAIVRELQLADFPAAMAFVNAVAGLAEAANHHPDILRARVEPGAARAQHPFGRWPHAE